MQQPLLCSKNRVSSLIRLFTQRVGVAEGCADQAMRSLVTKLSVPAKRRGPAAQLDEFLIKRRILETDVVSGLSSDGYIEPIGCTFRDGFRMVLKGGSAQTRSRFTIAHELCHTFFYEIVPEVKFGSQEVDAEEERLCNLGAGELLIPTNSLKRRAKRHRVSVDSLEELAAAYVVSPEAMLLRLRSLRLWNCELSFWRPARRGFSLDRLVGGRRVNWVWPDDAPLQRAWGSNGKIAGRTYLELRDSGGLQLRPVCFQLVRRGNSIMALWSAKPIDQEPRSLPLFENQGKIRASVRQ